VRIDSGDFLELSRAVRRILDEGGMPQAKIMASGDLDETRIAALLEAGAPIDAFVWVRTGGVGRRAVNGRDL